MTGEVTATRTPALGSADAALFAGARLRAARMQPYLASAVFALVPVARPGYGTFGVDRWWRVYMDMDVARGWGVEATAAVLLHEAHHMVRDHHGRADRLHVTTTQARRWNLAGDAAINDDLVAEGLPVPDPVLPRHLGLTDGGVEEAYFRHLLAQSEQADHHSCGSGAGGTPLPVEIDADPEEAGAGGVDEVDAGAVRRAVADDVVRSQDQGRPVSPGLARWARDLLCPQVPWRSMLRSALGHNVRAVAGRLQPDWARVDRRADSRPDFPRAGARHHRPDITVVIDTSASMTPTLLDAAVTEINSLLHRAGINELTVVVCDCTAARPQRVRRLGQLTMSGGGGTDLRIGIAAAVADRPTPSVIIVLTDGWTPWPTAAPARTTLIAVVIGAEAPLPGGPGIVALRIDEPR